MPSCGQDQLRKEVQGAVGIDMNGFERRPKSHPAVRARRSRIVPVAASLSTCFLLVGGAACTEGGPQAGPHTPTSLTVSTSPSGGSGASTLPLGPGPFDALWAKGLTGEIAFTRQVGQDLRIFRMRADGTHMRLLVNTKQIDFYPQWSPDGSRIVFRHGSPSSDTADVYVVNADGTGLRGVTRNPDQRNWNPTWSPNGRWIAFSSTRGGVTPQLYVIHPDGSHVRRVVSGWGEAPRWSPDGAELLFSSRRDGNFEIYVVNVDGTNLTRLTRTPQDESAAVWSPDGGQIAFDSERDTVRGSSSQGQGFEPHRQLYVMNAEGSNVRRVTFDTSSENVLLWLSTGRLLFHSDDCGTGPPPPCHSGDFLVNPDGSGVERLPRAAHDLDWRSATP
jgi:dipeptidyl aminopeptidase/acylaminoacyl peptidase